MVDPAGDAAEGKSYDIAAIRGVQAENDSLKREILNQQSAIDEASM